jgi:uncharacterized membrane protein YphA (DoxX/SURF4 family)
VGLDFLNFYNNLGLWALKLSFAVIFLYHSWPKLKNIKNLFGIGGFFHGLVEFFAPLAIIFGWYVREAGLALAFIMLGAIYMKKLKWNTSFSTMTTGWEFDLILLGVALYFVFG